MNKIILGEKGSGKSKRLIQETNTTSRDLNGESVFIDVDNKNMFQVDHNVRFISIKDYRINTDEKFIGFINGIVASNYDIEMIFIDNLHKITGREVEELEEFFNVLKDLELKFNLNFVITLTKKNEDLPLFLSSFKVYEIESK